MKKQLVNENKRITALFAGIILLIIIGQPFRLPASVNQFNPDEERTEAFNGSEILKSFIDTRDLYKFKKNSSFNFTNESSKVDVESICEPGKQYAFYFHHVDSNAKQIEYQDKLGFNIANGTFRADWINPATKKIIHTEYFSVEKEKYKLVTPKYSSDMVLKIIRIL